MPPRIGLLLPQFDCEIEATMAAARSAERAGLDIWIAGQALPISGQPWKPAFEPLTLMGALATATSSARLGFMVLAAPYYPSFQLAKAMITLDHLSGGRLEVGLGAGWRAEEFAALEVPFESGASRRRRLLARIEAIEELAAGRAFTTAAGEGFESGPAAVQPRLPLWIAGRGPKILELVGERADWANFARGISAAEFAAAAAAAGDAAAAAGREDGGPRLSLTATFLAAPEEAEVEARVAARAAERGADPATYREQLLAANVLVGTPAALARQVAPFLDAGCEALILWPLDGDHRGAPATLAELGAALA